MPLAIEGEGNVWPLVETLNEEAASAGASKDAIRQQVETALQRCGIPTSGGVGASIYYVNLSVLVHGASGYSAFVESSVFKKETVRKAWVNIYEWHEGAMLSGPPGTLAADVRRVLGQHLGAFCAAYQKAKQSLNSEKGK
jgi:hypothetical protein